MTYAEIILRVRRALGEPVAPNDSVLTDTMAMYSPSTSYSDHQIMAALLPAQRVIQESCEVVVQPDAIRPIVISNTNPVLPANVIRVLESRVYRNMVRCKRITDVRTLKMGGRPYSAESPVYVLSGGFLRVYPQGGTSTAYVIVGQSYSDVAALFGAEMLIGPQVREAVVQLTCATLRASVSEALMSDLHMRAATDELMPYYRDAVRSRFMEREVHVEQDQE